MRRRLLIALSIAGVSINLAAAWLVFSTWRSGEPLTAVVTGWAVMACLAATALNLRQLGERIQDRD